MQFLYFSHYDYGKTNPSIYCLCPIIEIPINDQVYHEAAWVQSDSKFKVYEFIFNLTLKSSLPRL